MNRRSESYSVVWCPVAPRLQCRWWGMGSEASDLRAAVILQSTGKRKLSSNHISL
jgi:hypothetical protein